MAYELRISDWSSDVALPISPLPKWRESGPIFTRRSLGAHPPVRAGIGHEPAAGPMAPRLGLAPKGAAAIPPASTRLADKTHSRIACVLALRPMTASILGDRMPVTGRTTPRPVLVPPTRSEEHTSELQSLMRTSYPVFCLKKKNTINT